MKESWMETKILINWIVWQYCLWDIGHIPRTIRKNYTSFRTTHFSPSKPDIFKQLLFEIQRVKDVKDNTKESIRVKRVKTRTSATTKYNFLFIIFSWFLRLHDDSCRISINLLGWLEYSQPCAISLSNNVKVKQLLIIH